MAEDQAPSVNRLLAALAPMDRARLTPELQMVPLARLAKLEFPDRHIEHIYFFESGIASVVSVHGASMVEVGVIGHEGMSGIPVINGNDRSPYSTFMQVAGSGQRIVARRLHDMIDGNTSLRTVFARFAQTFLIQTSQTAVANARATIEQRLARWLLMSHDRVAGDVLPLTHDFLSVMMGVGRPGVTSAVHALANRGFIVGGRGQVTIADRSGLLAHAGEYYGLAESEYDRLMPEANWRLRVV